MRNLKGILLMLLICEQGFAADGRIYADMKPKKDKEALARIGQITPKSPGFEVFQRTKCLADYLPKDLHKGAYKRLKETYPKCWGIHESPYMYLDLVKVDPPRSFAGGLIFKDGKLVIEQASHKLFIPASESPALKIAGSIKLQDRSILQWCKTTSDGEICNDNLAVESGGNYFLKPKAGVIELMVKLRPYFRGKIDKKAAAKIIKSTNFKNLLSVLDVIKEGDNVCRFNLVYETKSTLELAGDTFEVLNGLTSCPFNDNEPPQYHGTFILTIF